MGSHIAGIDDDPGKVRIVMPKELPEIGCRSESKGKDSDFVRRQRMADRTLKFTITSTD